MENSEYIINAISAVVAIEYMDCSFKKKYEGVRRWAAFFIGCFAYFVTVSVLKQVVQFEGILGVFYGVIVIGYAFLVLDGNSQDFMAIGLLWVLIVLICTYGIFGAIGAIQGMSLEEMLKLQGYWRLIVSFVVLIAEFSMGKIVSGFVKKHRGIDKREIGVFAGTFLLIVFMALGMFVLEIGKLNYSDRYWLTIGILVDEIGIIVILVLLYHQIGVYQKDKLEQQYQMEWEEECQERLLDMYRVSREINHWRHDMFGELSVLYRMQKNGKYKEVEAYIENMCGNLKDYPELPQPTGNEGLDAALMKMIPKCKEKGIQFNYVILGQIKSIDRIALGNLMDNLLSNGIEACGYVQEEREIELVVRDQGTELEIHLENSIDESVLRNNPKLKSRKRDQERHGFGMASIYRIVKEYGGTYESWEENRHFCQRIVLKYLPWHC